MFTARSSHAPQPPGSVVLGTPSRSSTMLHTTIDLEVHSNAKAYSLGSIESNAMKNRFGNN